MWAALLLLASSFASADELTVPGEQCFDVRQFRGGGRGGCRVAIDKTLAWMCIETRSKDTLYVVRFRNADRTVVKKYSYDKRSLETWNGHDEVFFLSSSDRKTNPDLKVGLTPESDATIVVGRARYCMPAAAAQLFKR